MSKHALHGNCEGSTHSVTVTVAHNCLRTSSQCARQGRLPSSIPHNLTPGQ